MQELFTLAAQAGDLLKQRNETIAVAESSSGGLISSALLSVPGASQYFRGGAVVYTREARRLMLNITEDDVAGIRNATEPYARLLATTVRERFASDWGLAETGATGPTGNRYGDAAGHCCLAVTADASRAITLETGDSDRLKNMQHFSCQALQLLLDQLSK